MPKERIETQHKIIQIAINTNITGNSLYGLSEHGSVFKAVLKNGEPQWELVLISPWSNKK